MATTVHVHPALPFIKVEITPDDDDIPFEDGDSFRIESTVDDEVLEHAYLTTKADAQSALDSAERHFFSEHGPFLHLRDKMDEAAERGDLDTLRMLAEGLGYWRGVNVCIDGYNARIRGWSSALPRFTVAALPRIETKARPAPKPRFPGPDGANRLNRKAAHALFRGGR